MAILKSSPAIPRMANPSHDALTQLIRSCRRRRQTRRYELPRAPSRQQAVLRRPRLKRGAVTTLLMARPIRGALGGFGAGVAAAPRLPIAQQNRRSIGIT
jgi:hypothetical protein